MDLSDIVFENRNKEYGAYYLKKRYVKYLAVSFLIIMVVIGGFVGYSIAYKFYDISNIPMPRGVVYEPTYISEEEISIPEPPEEKLQEPEPDEINEVPVVTDSLKNVAHKEAEKPKEEQKPQEDTSDSSAGAGKFGTANGDLTVAIQRMPQFPGGEDALASFLQKKLQHVRRNKKGIVLVTFVVKRDGRVDNVRVVRSLTPELDQVCVTVVNSMPVWSPAMSGGRPIEFFYNLPITFY
ncbi:MAG TPA: TonB family protein [Bacteroidales bacterium]|nr:TonB family protein [Bacteroidales bacterium]